MNDVYDFTTGVTADYLKNTLGIKISQFSTAPLKLFKGVGFDQVIIRDGNAILKDGEDEYLMFAYLPSYFTKKYAKRIGLKKRPGMPAFHTVECETRNKFSNFIFSNKMPVDIYSRDEHKTYNDQYLRFCGNCKKEQMKSFWGFDSNKAWYDVILDYASSGKEFIVLSDGYVSFWKQISTAYREKQNWECECCGLNLSSPSDQKFLHVHHENGNKTDNREANFQSLCILCHAFEHLDKVKRGEGFIDLDLFVSLKQEELRSVKNQYLEEWLEYKKMSIGDLVAPF